MQPQRSTGDKDTMNYGNVLRQMIRSASSPRRYQFFQSWSSLGESHTTHDNIMVQPFHIDESSQIRAFSHSAPAPSHENRIRSKNDGTSSGALVADRLRQARKKASENTSSDQVASIKKHLSTPSSHSKPVNVKNLALPFRRTRIQLDQMMEHLVGHVQLIG